ncbi:MAG: DUF1285 domain-containing protein [Deltaproteobacteria bacterium]|nr:MAG: DUF1285 domain-containing protein [Deltaproteobacteria bacterium]
MVDKRQAGPSMAEGEMVSCEIFIDREGDWFHRGSRMHRSDIVSQLCQHVRGDEPSGRYIIEMGKQRCYLEVADAPFVVTRVLNEAEKDGDGQDVFLLVLKHLQTPEPLDPTTLWVGEEDVMYCKVREDRLPARFLRPAYYQLAAFIKEDSERGRYYLSLRGRRYYVGHQPGG